jgi:regulator of sirC expression with transglutaminase-like and TPR domain
MQSEISERFRALTTLPENQLGLAEGALVLAAEVRPELEIDRALESLDELVDRAIPLVEASDTPSEAVNSLNHVLFELEGFCGNKQQYDDPRNSFLDEVLTRRRGLPITLSILYVEVARRLGFEAYGVGFPGHFLAKVVDIHDAEEGEIIIDAFFARILRRKDCVRRLQAATGNSKAQTSVWLKPVSALEIYARVLNNLKILYLRQGEGLSALGCFDRILLLTPAVAVEIRDRAFLLERLECTHAAIEGYSHYLELASNRDDARVIRLRRDALIQRRPRLH